MSITPQEIIDTLSDRLSMNIKTIQGDPIASGFFVEPVYVLKDETWITQPASEE